MLDIPVHYYRDAKLTIASRPGEDNVVQIDAQGDAVLGMPELGSDTDHDWALVFDFYAVTDHFHFVEGLIWVYIIQHCCFSGRLMQRLIFTSPDWDDARKGRVQSKLIRLLYPAVEIVEREDGREYRSRHLVRMDRMLSKTKINKFLDQALPFGRPFVMQMCDQVRSAVGALPTRSRPDQRPRALYLKMPPGRVVEHVERGLLAVLRQTFDVASIDLATLTWEEQVRVVAESDILVGLHGKALTNLLWLRPGSVVIDILPPGYWQYDYQLLCELTGIRYFGLEGDRVHREHGRDGPCRGTGAETGASVEALDWTALKDVRAAVCCSFGMLV